MAQVTLHDLVKRFSEDVIAVNNISLEIQDKEFIVLVGPSGCGKTTLLRLIAGLEQPTSGRILLGSERLDHVPPQRRDVAMVFQNYALYPHMTVRENLSFGLKIRKIAKETIRERIEAVAKNLEIDGLLERRPAELSGGQRQRVALGRAVVREPRVFLFDEPLSNLDARLRDEMRYMIRKLYGRLKTTTVYVTHDQVEAMTIGELLVVMRDGRIHQVGAPLDCYRRPNDTFVASFLGSPPMNLIDGVYDDATRTVRLAGGTGVAVPDAVAAAGEREIVVGVRPEDLEVGNGDGGGGVTFTGAVALAETLGHETLTHIQVGGKEVVVRSARRPDCEPGGRLTVSAAGGALHFFSNKTGGRIGA